MKKPRLSPLLSQREDSRGYCFTRSLQAHLVVDLLALFDDDAPGQLLGGEACRGGSDLFAIHQNAALHDQTAGLAVGSSQTSLDHQGQDADGAIGQVSLGQLSVGNSARAAFCALLASSSPWTILVSSKARISLASLRR